MDLLRTNAKDLSAYGFVYLITNLINKKRYVGQTTKNILYRWNRHIIASKKENKKKFSILHQVIRKYSKENFKVEFIALASNKDILNQFEETAINKFMTNKKEFGYNIRSGGYSSNYNEDYCKEWGIYLKKNRVMSSEWRKKLGEAGKENLKKVNIEKRILATKIALTGKKKSKEDIDKRNLKRRKKVIAINKNTSEKIIFDGIRVAARALNLDTSMISKVCKKQHSYYKDWYFEYYKG